MPKKTLNKRRLTRAEVQKLIAAGSKPRPDLLAADTTKLWGAIYELPGDRMLTVFDPPFMPGLRGKGDIWPKDDLLRSFAWANQVDLDYAEGRGGSVSHWAYYSRAGSELPEQVPALLANLPAALKIDETLLDLSYPSLDAVSAALEREGVEQAKTSVYDELVAYVGEMMRRRLSGTWAVHEDSRNRYPYVRLKAGVEAMPINAVWEALAGPGPIDLRAATARESRRAALEARLNDGLPSL